MMSLRYKKIFLLPLLFLLKLGAIAQDIKIELGPDELPSNRLFTITITVNNERLQSYSAFPDIPGFDKRGTSSRQSTNYVNGRMSSSQSITQNYVARAQGVFELKPFSITVNDKKINSPGKKIKVVAPQQQQQQQRPFDPFGADPFDDLFGKRDTPTEYVEVQDDAFFALNVSKNEVYVGEGFTATLAFYVAEANRAVLQFYDLNTQIADILKKIKQANCWEENFNIENISEEPVMINGKRYSQYKLFQATFYPLNTKTVEFPDLNLKMIKYKEAKNRTAFGRSRQEDYKTYLSRAKAVKVKPLPPHPLRDQVPVGEYKLNERLSMEQAETGEGVNYHFTVYGEGNINGVPEPTTANDADLDIYPPSVSQNIVRQNARVRGDKTFTYYLSANEAGNYALGEYMSLIFFNPKTAQYDTLIPKALLKVVGDKVVRSQLGKQQGKEDDYIDLIADSKNTIMSKKDPHALDAWIYGGIVLLLALGTYLLIKKNHA